jgi:uncharacterized protein YcnI
MSNTTAGSRRTIRIAVATAALGAAAVLGAAPAWAHVHVEADHAEPGEYAILTFKVPNESDTGSATTQLAVALPNLTSVSTEEMPGWTAKLDRDVAAGTVKSITWTAAPNGGIGRDEFGLFRVSVKLPEGDFPATQTYADGTVVQWDQPEPPGAAEPEHPAPTVTFGAEPAEHPAPAADGLARWLGAGGLVVAVAALVLTWLRGRRT